AGYWAGPASPPCEGHAAQPATLTTTSADSRRRGLRSMLKLFPSLSTTTSWPERSWESAPSAAASARGLGALAQREQRVLEAPVRVLCVRCRRCCPAGRSEPRLAPVLQDRARAHAPVGDSPQQRAD